MLICARLGVPGVVSPVPDATSVENQLHHVGWQEVHCAVRRHGGTRPSKQAHIMTVSSQSIISLSLFCARSLTNYAATEVEDISRLTMSSTTVFEGISTEDFYYVYLTEYIPQLSYTTCILYPTEGIPIDIFYQLYLTVGIPIDIFYYLWLTD